MAKTKETRGRGPAPALLAEHLRATVVAAPDSRLGIRDRSMGLTCFCFSRSCCLWTSTTRRSPSTWRSTGGATSTPEHDMTVGGTNRSRPPVR
jgi:hypothetical protein